MIIQFRAHEKSVFGVYQLSGMTTQNLHRLDYLVDAIKHVGGIKFLHGGLHEWSHRILKRYMWKLLSKKNAMNDSVHRYSEKLHNR